MPPISCKDHVKDYCSKCTFTGVHFVADDTKHWTERLLWAVLIVLSWYGSALLIDSAWEAFVKSPISFGVETIYIDWETKLPAVAICEDCTGGKFCLENIYRTSDLIWPANHAIELEVMLQEIAYYNGQSYSLITNCFQAEKKDPLCPLSNYSYYSSVTRTACADMLADCSYNDVTFDCCEYFLPIETDIGPCYIINSIQTKLHKPLPMVSSIKQKSGIFRFEIFKNLKLFTLGEDEIPSVTSLMSSYRQIILGNIYHLKVSVKNIENHPLLEETTPEQRACRFHHENEDGLYPHYSYSACNIRCRKEAQLKLCYCNDHFMPGATKAERCNITGMACLHENYRQLSILKPKWATRPGLTCDCVPSCNETEINIIKDSFRPLASSNRQRPKLTRIKSSYIEIVLAFLPSERFKRNVVRSRLDLVVSVGGTAGLFVGASLLSFVELIFFFTVRFISNVWMEKRKHNNNVHQITN